VLAEAMTENLAKVLGVDSSLVSTGLCLVEVHPRPSSMPFRTYGEPVSWSAELRTITSKPRKPVTWPNTSARIEQIVLSLAHAMAHVDLVVLEGRSYSSPGHGLELDWLWGRIVDEVLQQNRRLLVVTPAQRSKYATDKGNAKKDIVLAAAIHRFPTVPIEGNDTADATILAAIGCRHLGFPIDTMPKSHWESIMPKLAE
jgi:crossover junction endodeoxyribonuclease RuvC